MDIMSAFRTSIEQIVNWSNNKLLSKVDKVDGKALSTNDYTQTDKEKVNNMATSLSISDVNLFLSNDSGIIESSGVTLPAGPAGPAGQNGHTPIKGTDYFTDSDKEEIVNSVLSSLPTWNGGSY